MAGSGLRDDHDEPKSTGNESCEAKVGGPAASTTQTATHVYIPKGEMEMAQKKLDLGESMLCSVYLYPHKDVAKHCVRFAAEETKDD